MEKYVERCYHSLAIQKDADDIEFIFVNDGSVDNTLSILQKLEKDDNRVVVINQNNAGVSVARNVALKIAKGEYIYLLDGDDYMEADSIKRIKHVIESYNPDIIMPSYNVVVNETILKRNLPFKNGLYKIFELFERTSYFPLAPQLLYKRHLIIDNKLHFNPLLKRAEVYSFTMSVFKYANNIYVLNEPCFNYFVRNNSATHLLNYNDDLTVIKALHSIYMDGQYLFKYGSFHLTSFKLLMSFTYKKYLHNTLTSETYRALDNIYADRIVCKCIKNTVIKKHSYLRERLLAIYLYIMPKHYGLKLLHFFYNLNQSIVR